MSNATVDLRLQFVHMIKGLWYINGEEFQFARET